MAVNQRRRHERSNGVLRAALLVLTILAITAGISRPAAAEDLKQRAKVMSDEAAALFMQKRFPEAAERFEQAYALDSDIIVRLRNAGRAWEEANRSNRALHCFERYLTAERDEALRKDAMERIARHRALIAEGRTASTPSGADDASDASAQGVSDDRAAVATASPASRWLPYASAAASLALLGTGVVWLAQVDGAATQIEDDERDGNYGYPGGEAKMRGDRDTVSLNRTVAWSLVGAGVAVGGFAAWRWLRSDAPSAAAMSHGAAATPVAAWQLWPVVAPEASGLVRAGLVFAAPF